MKYVVDGVVRTKPDITKTFSQAEIRARGLLGKGASRALSSKVIEKRAREALSDWLDGLTMLVRNLDLIISQQADQEPGYYVALTRSIRELLFAPLGTFVMAYKVVSVAKLSPHLPPIETIRGHGWSWDEAFEMLEKSLEKDRAEREAKEATP